MRQNISGKAGSYAARHKRRSHWRRLLMALACVVVFCTTYALILPAITLENPEALDAPVCGLEEHIHSESCFEARPEAQHKQFHCCDGGGNLVGISSDLVLHTHDEQCYDPDGTLVCPLPEITAHTHDASCYHASLVSQGHHHTEACISEWVQGELICALPTEAHVHGEGCHDGSGELICQVPEQAHVHTDECYERLPVYSCNQEESEDVYGEQELTCQRREVFPHTHSTDCYDGSGNLTCGHLQVVSHQHTAECYDLVTVPAQTVQTCTIPEHTHTEACFPQNSEQASDILVGDSIPADLESDLASSNQESNGILTDQDSNAALFASGATGGGSTYEITGVTLEHSSDGANWRPLNSGDALNVGDLLRFHMDYTIPIKGLTLENDTIIYKLDLPLNASSGIVKNKDRQEVGQYTIAENGEIRITFNESAIQKNQSSPAEGDIYFFSSVEKIRQDDQDKIEFEIGGDTYEIIVVEDSKKSNDLKIQKTGITSADSSGIITYTVTVNSEGGTSDAVELHDVRFGNAENTSYVPDSFVISGPNGAEGRTVAIAEDGNSFGLTLPKMNAGDTYTITYQVKASNLANGTTSVGNKVTATSKDNKGKDIFDEQEIWNNIITKTLEKEGTLKEDGTISWTVTVNERGLDISKWELSDILNGEAYTGTVTITPGPNGEDSAEINLPYTFPEGSNQKYTITYPTTSDVKLPMGQDKITNKAILKAPGDQGEIGTETGVDVPLPPYLTKESDSYTTSEDGKTAIAQWIVTINSERGPIEAPWVYSDEAWDGQWFTGNQLKAMKESLDAGLEAAGLKNLVGQYTITANRQIPPDGSDWQATQWENIEPDGRYKWFHITFNEGLEEGHSFTHRYETTMPIEGLAYPKEFRNRVNLNDKVYDLGSIKYEPPKQSVPTIEKTGTGETNALSENWEGIRWNIKVTVPQAYSGGDLTMVEHLPANTSLSKLKVWIKGQVDEWNAKEITEAGHYLIMETWDGTRFEVDVDIKGSDITVVIPETLATNQHQWNADSEIYFAVYVKPTNDFDWGSGEGEYWVPKVSVTNSVELQKNGTTIDESSDDATVIKDDKKYPLSKGHVGPKSNEVTYTLDINPKGVTLNEGGGPLVLEDILDVTRKDVNQVELIENSLKVCHVTEGGEVSLDASQYSYKYVVESIATGEWPRDKHTITLELPDGMPLRVTYKYLVFGDENSSVTLKNAATLHSLQSGEVGSSGDDTYVTIKYDGATANLTGITIYKVDANNYLTRLQGAEFWLYEYNSETKTYDRFYDPKTDSGVWITDQNGSIALDGLQRNTAYMLKEVNPPEGYLIKDAEEYFYVYDKNAPKNIPEDFVGTQLLYGGSLHIENTSDKTQITVKKVWKDTDGTDLEQVPNSPITVQLYRKKTAEGEGELCKSVDIGPGNSWTHTFTGLSKTWVDENGTRQNYLYYVEEEPYSGYETTYGNNDGINSSVNADGVVINPITITNTKSSSYALPNTGGPGAVMYMAGGLAIASVSLLLLYIEIKHRRKGNASF